VKMTEARNVLTASYDFSDEPVEIEDKDGLAEAIEHVAENKDNPQYVEQPGMVVDYKVYWNGKTNSVRFAAMVAGASYDVPDGFVQGESNE